MILNVLVARLCKGKADAFVTNSTSETHVPQFTVPEASKTARCKKGKLLSLVGRLSIC